MSEEEKKLTRKERKALKKQRKAEKRNKEEATKKRNKWLTYLLIFTGVALVAFYFYNKQIPIAEEEKNKPIDVVQASDWVKGNPEAEVVLIEYSDFQCPACQAYAGFLKQVESEYGENVAIVYRHFPLKQIHFQAVMAAQATEAAGKQGKFWEMHDLLFENQEDWAGDRSAEGKFVEYAGSLGVDVDLFKKDLNSKEVQGLVEADYVDGISRSINGTPTFYLNGEKIENPTNVEGFGMLIQASLPATESGEILE